MAIIVCHICSRHIVSWFPCGKCPCVLSLLNSTSFPLVSPLLCFKKIGKKRKRLTHAGRCLCFFLLYCNIFCDAFMLCKLHYLECSPPKEIILFYFFFAPRMWYFSPSFPHCALRQYYTIGENKTKKQQFYKTDLCTTAWRNILHLERLNLQGDEIGVRLTFPAPPPIRRKAIGNGEIREVI